MTRQAPSSLAAPASSDEAQHLPQRDIVVAEKPPKNTFTIHTSLLFDPHQKVWRENVSIEVDKQTGLIASVSADGEQVTSVEEEDVDLRGYTVMPGFVDAHSHVFLHDYKEASSINQERDESFVERVVRGTMHCRKALLAGYTTYRDLGTEGIYSADVSLRDTIARHLTPGPRLFVATEPLASSSGYAIRTESSFPSSLTSSRSAPISTLVPRISDPCDGPWACRAAVRRRLGAGADVIKFYADYRKRALQYPGPAYPGGPKIAHPPEESGYERNPALPLWTQEEMDAIVDEAKRARCPVAAHAIMPDVAIMASKAGVTSVEHAYLRSDDVIRAFKENGTIWVPTLSVLDFELGGGPVLEAAQAQVFAAWKAGVVLAAGGDVGAFSHGENIREVELMLEAGVPLEDVLVAVTLTGWKACGGEWVGRRFGGVKAGWAADFVALEGDLRKERGALRKVQHVVKDGEVIVRDGVLTR